MMHPIIASARLGNLADTDQLLTEDAGAALFVDDKGWTAAHYAAQLGHLSVLQRLHESHPSVLSTPIPTGAGKRPAHLAAEWKSQAVLQWIAGVDPALLMTADKMGRTAVSIVSKESCGGSAESARALLGLGSRVRSFRVPASAYFFMLFCCLTPTDFKPNSKSADSAERVYSIPACPYGTLPGSSFGPRCTRCCQ